MSSRDFVKARNEDRITETKAVEIESGSFRDRCSRVFTYQGELFRALNDESYASWQFVSQQPFFSRMMDAGKIVKTELLELEQFELFQLPGNFVAALHHERVPFVSYPYEWSFGMLREAALIHLELLQEAVSCGLILKDASPFNVQFSNSQAVFIDLGSFIMLNPGEPWSAYRQFCEQMLYPLMLQSYRQFDVQPILRSQLEGISSREFLQRMRLRDYFRPGVLTHGWLQDFLDQFTRDLPSSAVSDLRSSGFDTSLIINLLRKLTRLVERMEWNPRKTQWTEYDERLPHVAEDVLAKSNFVKAICQTKHRQLVWDLGCNNGHFAQIAHKFATTVVAIDQDHACINRLHKSLTASRKNILPLCVDLANPSPAQGWRGQERKRLEDRGRPDLVICLGLIHHLVIAANIPLPEVIDWLASLGGEIVLEFPSKNDAMVKALLRNKRDQYSDYSLERLLSELEIHFEICLKVSLPSGERTLFHLVPKALA